MNSKDNSEQEKATRGIRKQMKKALNNKPSRGKSALYDGSGIHIATGKDLCDCLVDNCIGCHMPCPKCQSRKCGHECRVNRKWCYDTVEMDGSDVIIKNKNK